MTIPVRGIIFRIRKRRFSFAVLLFEGEGSFFACEGWFFPREEASSESPNGKAQAKNRRAQEQNDDSLSPEGCSQEKGRPAKAHGNSSVAALVQDGLLPLSHFLHEHEGEGAERV